MAPSAPTAMPSRAIPSDPSVSPRSCLIAGMRGTQVAIAAPWMKNTSAVPTWARRSSVPAVAVTPPGSGLAGGAGASAHSRGPGWGSAVGPVRPRRGGPAAVEDRSSRRRGGRARERTPMMRATTSKEAGEMHVSGFAATDRGRVRERNEDAYHCGTTLFAVADGLGGHRAGEIASGIAIEVVAKLDQPPPDDPDEARHALMEAFAAAHPGVRQKGSLRPPLLGHGNPPDRRPAAPGPAPHRPRGRQPRLPAPRRRA